MKNIWRLFKGDVKRLTSNVVTGIIVLGLVFLPSIFSWYNILACWDVFDNTGNLTVAVANTDEGHKSDLVPLKVNIGEQVVSALRANDQMDWEFTNEEDAVDGARSGKYYAAVVIPPSFSKDMMTFYSDDVEHAQIVYYTNEKKSAVAPKVTDQGADRISYQVNEVFAETLTEAALGISTSLYQYADTADANSRVGELASHVSKMGTQVSQTASMLSLYGQIAASSQSLVASSADLLSQTMETAGEVQATVGEGTKAVQTIADATASSLDALIAALEKSAESYDSLGKSIDTAFAETDTLSKDSASALRSRANAVNTQVEQYRLIIDELEELKDKLTNEEDKATIDVLIARLNASIGLQEDLRDGMNTAADEIESGNADAMSQHAEVKRLATEAQQSIDDLVADYNANLKPTMQQMSREMAYSVELLNNAAERLGVAGDGLVDAAGSVSGRMGEAKQKIDVVAGNLNGLSNNLAALGQGMTQALASGDMQTLRKLLQSDAETLASAFAAPVKLDRQAVFPADNFGSQMAPLYTTLALWIGALLLVVAIKVIVSEKARSELDDPKPHELFFGRFGVFAVASFIQTTSIALGNMLFLGVQANEPFLYLLCFWISGLVFTFIIYALVVAFANLGKAIAVLMLIVQVTSGGGSFPLQLLPQFFQVLSPYLPATHTINAMRAAMMGIYQYDFWIEMGELLLFVIPAALVGLVLSRPFERFMSWYISKVEESKLVS